MNERGCTTATVRDPLAAALLVDHRRNRFLKPFLARERCIADVARELGVGKSLVSYWVGRLKALGLLRPVEGEPGHGRRRLYRSSADCFVVALEDVPLESDEAILSAQMDPPYERFKRSVLRAARRHVERWQFRIERTADGVSQDLVPREGGSLEQAQMINQRIKLHLRPADAVQLRAEMRALVERYRVLSDPELNRRGVLVWLCAVEDAA